MVKLSLFWALLVQTLVAVLAYEQIYAINSGGPEYTDADGIYYRKDTQYTSSLKSSDVADENTIYQSIAKTNTSTPEITYDLPVRGDGLYALVTKYNIEHIAEPKTNIMDIVLNENILVASYLDLFYQCETGVKFCEYYIYFCVHGNQIYSNVQTSDVQDNKTQVTFRSRKGDASVAGLALLKGKVGERTKLASANEFDTLYFDPFEADTCASKVNVNLQQEKINKAFDLLQNLVTLQDKQVAALTRLETSLKPK